ncbi:hypothetical protein QHH11_15935 [Aphanizomenon sp. PH219]|nr:hypothetical protein [Aphanizomenon sp. 202]MDK2460608.1 hypothetical protein [Aphanizomenon sp. PH219]
MSRKRTYQQALEKAGMPSDIAKDVSEIVDRDNPNKPNLGRSKQEQELISDSIKYLQN